MSVNEKGLMWGSEGVAPSLRRHRGSGGRAPSDGWLFNRNYVLLGIFGLKFLLQNIIILHDDS